MPKGEELVAAKEAEIKTLQQRILADKPSATQIRTLQDAITKKKKVVEQRTAKCETARKHIQEWEEENHRDAQQIKEMQAQLAIVSKGVEAETGQAACNVPTDNAAEAARQLEVALASLEKMGERLGCAALTGQYVRPIREHLVPK
eukprot:9400242-Pyramimonas_sp.AAC.1